MPPPDQNAAPELSDLVELEAVVSEALASRDDSALSILGYGEVSVALGWPIGDPRFVCKRTPPFPALLYAEYAALVTEYIAEVEERGLAVVSTKVIPLERGGDVVAYLVQPKLDSDTLGENVLKAANPDPDHPFLTALVNSLDVVTATVSIDAQVTNFSWDGSGLTLIDVGTPFMWNGDGTLRLNMKSFMGMFPAPARALAARELTKLVERWNDPRTVGLDIVANLYREGLNDWVDPMVIALNRRSDLGEPITAAEAHKLYEEDLKLWPILKKLQRAERWWQTSIRKRPYGWFIYSTF